MAIALQAEKGYQPGAHGKECGKPQHPGGKQKGGQDADPAAFWNNPLMGTAMIRSIQNPQFTKKKAPFSRQKSNSATINGCAAKDPARFPRPFPGCAATIILQSNPCAQGKKDAERRFASMGFLFLVQKATKKRKAFLRTVLFYRR